uniref:aminoacylase-1-like n=1 Tax=Styela clava TaxID=7725 RepID=UPI00193AC1BB|nr:aminoacylase-1-like [Styela clava]
MQYVGFDKTLAVRKFQEYLRIKTDHPNPDYERANEFLIEYAEELQVKVKLVPIGDGERSIVLMLIPGKQPELPSILLNSHIDVSCADYANWKQDPWSAYKDDIGNIHGVGAQDMKCVGIQYLEAIRILTLLRKERFERNIYISFIPDEQINDGSLGMTLFIQTQEFKNMNVGFAMDEGLANPLDQYSVYYGEKIPWWVRVKCQGQGGHSSNLIGQSAAEKFSRVIASFMSFREGEIEKLKNNSTLRVGDVTSIELTVLGGGERPNSIPPDFSATFDVRIPPSVNLTEFEEMLTGWCQQAGKDVTLEFLYKGMCQVTTRSDESSPWWITFTEALRENNLKFSKEIHPAFSDGRFLREIGIPVIGFSPMKNTPIALFTSDEFLNEDVFLDGIRAYCAVISAVANLDTEWAC